MTDEHENVTEPSAEEREAESVGHGPVDTDGMTDEELSHAVEELPGEADEDA